MEPRLSSPTYGIRQFFDPVVLRPGGLRVRGLGVRERMPPCRIERPRGRSDYLLMLFHDPAHATTRPEETAPHPPETLMIWPPDKPQYYGNRARPFCHTWIHCDGAPVAAMLRSCRLPLLRPVRVPDPSHFEQCLLGIHAELVAYTRPDGRIVANLLENGLRGIARSVAPRADTARVPENLLAVRRLIGTAPARALTLRELAAIAGMSVPHFCARFKATFGLPPIECLIQHRMHHAAHLLANRALTLSQIAAQVGYDDAFHFSKMFKKHFGVSPRTMRRRLHAGEG